MKKTALNSWHKNNGGKMINFAGWELPVQYHAGAVHEHRIVRESAGLFDISHMGRFEIFGDDAEIFLNYLCTKDISSIPAWGSGYSLLCNEKGGILDDIFLYHHPEKWLMVVNASNVEKDFTWLTNHKSSYNIELKNVSDLTGMIAVQGPKAVHLMDIILKDQIKKIDRFNFNYIEAIEGYVCRTGYTGEDGVEIIVKNSDTVNLWKQILETGQNNEIKAEPAGLAARDSLRFEAGFPLYGHELTESIQPPQAKLKWVCDMNKDFIGKDAIKSGMEKGYTKKLTTFMMKGKGVPREGYSVKNIESQKIGEVVSGMLTPTIEKFCGNAYVKSEYSGRGKKVYIEIRNRNVEAKTSKQPLYKPVYRK
jgi:glycine cleavage system T protein